MDDDHGYPSRLDTVDEQAGYAWERFTKFAVGPHSYRDHDNGDDLLEDIFAARPPAHGDTKDEYHEYVSGLLQERHETLTGMYEDAKEDGTAFIDAARVQKDESIYLVARSTMFVSGLGGVLSGQFWGTILGAPALAGSPLGMGNAYSNITEMQEEDVLEDELTVYEEALDELSSDGLDALPDEVSRNVRTPGIGKKNIEYSFDGETYQRAFVTPGEAARSLYENGRDVTEKIAGKLRETGGRASSFFNRS